MYTGLRFRSISCSRTWGGPSGSCAWSASQATNVSDVDTSSWGGTCREDARSWCPLKWGNDPEWLLLNYSTAVWATSIEIFEVTAAQKHG